MLYNENTMIKNKVKNIQSEIDKIKDSEEIDNINDGAHSFKDLYYHRMVLFSVICKLFSDKAWKSKLHSDGTMYDNYFIVGVTTPDGDYSYHYDLKYWDKFNVPILDNAPVWDGHKPEDIDRLYSLL